MMQPVDHHLAEFNFGTLRYDWDDARIQGFVDGLDLVNSAAARHDGFIWRMPDDQMDKAQRDPEGVFAGNPRVASTLSVWKDGESLDRFVWNTVHRQFYARKAEWYDVIGNGNLVLWWVPRGHRSAVEEGMLRWQHREANGDSDHAFGWSWLKEATLFRQHQCNRLAAE